MFKWILLLALGCGGEDNSTNNSARDKAVTAPAAPTTPQAPASRNAKKAEAQKEDKWGAIFWRDGQAWKIGGGTNVVSPKDSATVRVSGEPLVCDGIATKGAPPHSALVLPEGASLPTVVRAPAIQAHRVERAAWRLDEVLPPRGRFSPNSTSTSPARQRGVEVGSVVKTRRLGAPPILISTGVRDCVGAVNITDAKAEASIAYDRLPNTCSMLRVIPALDYDGDGAREFAVFNDERVTVYRLFEAPGQLGMTRIANWSCKSE
jgi:hypothetical protein